MRIIRIQTLCLASFLLSNCVIAQQEIKQARSGVIELDGSQINYVVEGEGYSVPRNRLIHLLSPNFF